jgi:hypothetical protein
MRANAVCTVPSSLSAAVPGALLSALLLSACGSQAGEGYRGESLLSMQGQATVLAPTGGEPVVPALCFYDEESTRRNAGIKSLALDHLPPDIEQDLRGDQPVSDEPPWPHEEQLLIHIVDVESTGRFPSEFDVEVYAPPPEETLSRAVPGGPRMAVGFVCAVKRDHRAVSRYLQFVENYSCNTEGPSGSSDCFLRFLWLIAGSDRYYSERYDCPDGVMNYEECTLTTKQGDATLKLETVGEDIVGAAASPAVVYLDGKAAPGTFAAWLFDASKTGLSAGYHLFGESEGVAPLWSTCMPGADEIIAHLAPEFSADEQLQEAIRGTPSDRIKLTWQQSDASGRAMIAAAMTKCPDRQAAPRLDESSLAVEIKPVSLITYGPPLEH